MNPEEVIAPVRHWVESLVVGMNLCPFAGRELASGRVRFQVSMAESEERLLADLEAELEWLDRDPAIETTLLIHPQVLQDFYAYNDFLDSVDRLLVQLDREGVYQVASFHPCYQFAGTSPDDVENYTNRAPYPLLHLIREESLERAIADYPDPGRIPERNVELMENLGRDKVQALLRACFKPPRK